MIADKRATEIEYHSVMGWGVKLENDSDVVYLFPNIANAAEAKGFIEGWNSCRRSIANEMLNNALKRKLRR